MQFECANTLTQINNTPTTLKMATNIYVSLLLSITDNSVKMVVLDKLANIKTINSKYLEEQLVDIAKVLSNQSQEIRRKTLELIQGLVNTRNIGTIFPLLIKELQKVAHTVDQSEIEFRNLLLEAIYKFVLNYEQVAESITQLIFEQIMTFGKLDEQSAS